MMFSKGSKILVVAAHSDDEILGCGGTVARLIKEGSEAYVLILGEGITSRDKKRDVRKRTREIKELKKQAHRAHQTIGVKETFVFDFPDNRFDTVPFLDIVKVVEEIKCKINPHVIFTHYEKDLNVDHRIAYSAVLTAARPVVKETVKTIYSFEVPSSTEWVYPLRFHPNTFFDITDTLKDKMRAMTAYRAELRDSSHPRSIRGIKLGAEYRGMQVGLKYAEAFYMVRSIK